MGLFAVGVVAATAVSVWIEGTARIDDFVSGLTSIEPSPFVESDIAEA
jgi:hypothetical protein